MSLKELWLTKPEEIRDKSVAQIMAFAGDGRLRDGSKSAEDFRAFLGHVTSSFLVRYSEECLKTPFSGSGLALQDIINEIGVRLGYLVEPGRYRGTSGSVGHDGIWRLDDGCTILIEVKTSDAYRIDLETIATYRRRLHSDGLIDAERTSVLIVVGREDTGDLEAQIRGSRHAWDMRLISVDSLCRLMHVKEELEDPATTKRIYEILIPREFTKLDSIIEILFSATEEVKHLEAGVKDLESTDSKLQIVSSPVAFNDQCVLRIEKKLKKTLIKVSQAKFKSPDGLVAVVCAVSKLYKRGSNDFYWYAFHPYQMDFLKESKESFVLLGCGSPKQLLVIPSKEFSKWLKGMHVTVKPDKMYYHVQISNEDSKFMLSQRKGTSNIDLTKYLLR